MAQKIEHYIQLAVNGTLMQGLELNGNLLEAGRRFVREARTDSSYRIWSIEGRHPAMIRSKEAGNTVELEIWELSPEGLVSVLQKEPAGLGIGKITLEDGSQILGVLGEPWLVGALRPDHWTINEFRKCHGDVLKQMMRQFHLLCRDLGLVGSELVALDSTFFKGSVNLSKIHSNSSLKKRLKEADKRIDEYLDQLNASDQNDVVKNKPDIQQIQKALEECEQLEAVQVYVPVKKERGIKKGLYAKEAFEYKPEEDVVICPQGERLQRKSDSRPKKDKRLYRIKLIKIGGPNCHRID